MDEQREVRIRTANEACRFFIPETAIALEKGFVVIRWQTYRGEHLSRRWSTQGQDFYPVWYQKWAHGGTCSTALSQLVRFVQGKPILPLSTWRYWCSDTVALARRNPGDAESLIKTLLDGGYPEHANCVLCGRQLSRFDWWSLKGVSGPCCNWTEGCRQTTTSVANTPGPRQTPDAPTPP